MATAPALERIVVAVDPAVSGTPHAHETGIVVAGRDARGHVYVVADESLRASPDRWARQAVNAYQRYGADELVAEGNQGGELVRLTLLTVDEDVSVRLVYATHGKRTRAEPVAALYEQGRVHHVGTFPASSKTSCVCGTRRRAICPPIACLLTAVVPLGSSPNSPSTRRSSSCVLGRQPTARQRRHPRAPRTWFRNGPTAWLATALRPERRCGRRSVSGDRRSRGRP